MTEVAPPAPTSNELTPAMVFRGTLVVVAVALGFWLVYETRDALFSLFAAIVISTAIAPGVDWLERRRLPRGAGVLTIYLALLAVLVATGLAIAPLVADQGPRIGSTLSEGYASLRQSLQTSPSRLVRRLTQQLPDDLSLSAPAIETEEPLSAVAQLFVYLGMVGDAVFVGVAVLLLAFYWTLERERLVRSLLLLLPVHRRDEAKELLEESEARVGGYIRGVAVLCVIVGGMAVVAYLLMGLPNALLLGLAAGLFEAVPVVGPALGALPAVAVALGIGPAAVGWVLAATALIQLVENTILVPRVMRHAVGVNPIVTLLSLVAFGQLFGLAGALLAIPLAAVLQLLIDRLLLNGKTTEVPTGRDRLSLLRYEARELAQDVRKRQLEKPAEVVDDGDLIEDKLEALATEIDALLERAQNGGKA